MEKNIMHYAERGESVPAQPPLLNNQHELRGTRILDAILMREKYPVAIPKANTMQCGTVPKHPDEMLVATNTGPGWDNYCDDYVCSTEVARTSVTRVSARLMSKLTPEEKQEIVDLFDRGRTCSYLMAEFDLSRYTIKQVLRAAGRPAILRKQDRKKFNELRLIVLQLLEQRWSLREIMHHTKAPRIWVKSVIKSAGSPLKTPFRRLISIDGSASTSSTSRSIVQDNQNTVTTTKLDAILRDSRSAIKWDSGIGRHHDKVGHEDIPLQNSRNESGAGASILSKNRQCKDTCPATEIAVERTTQEETDINKDRSAPGSQKKTDNSEAGFGTDIAFEQCPFGQRQQEEEITEYSNISSNRCVGSASAMTVFQSKNAVTRGSSGRYQCQICRLTYDEEKPFLLHLAGKEHERFYAAGIFLYCTACPFKTRKPSKMGRHITKYQLENIRHNGRIPHYVKSNS
ncbi:uncharacterized protein LOC129592248 [Paramacrobiotus metropolitanus]|uniref:uncharacterized protein LOC129592248 n=1 Tax=Paramacrobiotus metropolitanus TaxID=2943436 RepID=UPI002445D041|nr:uncharacterized protein LOC129592248 [Paramacrobiotus metropolitanus]XP_055344209.1 uncharacterized protein LOC129592248 [Paramacrobiotus metropolitanus]XP_055344211.1 uncharacterized protein LOC129592248 [Paramacrobiotus metropolitanus]XP_055344212.1 uncharacterized protein LOC129592248 [Paramacrobiotus metropolitanus]XP_055344213.1 uncharacterized protein LOC129592248 [Paramacrobiotus metropolitanus]XP_055344214.1 uncharacterized protein LOC129592248 [Paramacrobiotus metropolitanus]